MTEKLYYNEPHTLEFIANVTDIIPYDNNYAIFLDKTYFYPTSGGQPFDTGYIGTAKIIDVFEKDGKVFHISESNLEKNSFPAKINYYRRLEHLQHHTGQHLLSQAFIQIIKAPTISFHLGSETATIEIVIKDLNIEQANEVEDLANNIIYENRKINVHYVDESEVNNLNLRKPPKKKGDQGVRIIEIENFDMSACGGTHAQSTGELGMIKIIGWEKYKGNIKVEFICGRRALLDYRFKNIAIKNIANKFSTKDNQIEEIITKSIDDTKNISKQINILKKELVKYQAKELILLSEKSGDFNLIINIFDNTEISNLVQIGQELILEENTISFLLSTHDNRTRLVLCCNENIKLNLNKISAEIFALINGKGGGKPNFIQGSGDITNLDDLVNKFKNIIQDIKI